MAKQITPQMFMVVKESSQKDKPDFSGGADTRSWPYDYGALAALMQLNTWHARCVEVVAGAAVGVGYDLAADDETKEKEARSALEALVEDSFSNFCAFIIEALRATGVAYIEVVRNAKNEIAELYPVLPQTIWINKDPTTGFTHKPEKNSNTKVAFKRFGEQGEGNEIIMLKTPCMADRHYGLPRWLPCMGAIDLDASAIDYNRAFFSNSAIPEMAIIVEGGEFSPEVEEAVKNFLTNNFKGADNAHRTLYIPVTDPNVKVRLEPLNKQIRDAAFHQLRVDDRDEIIGAHGVPPRIVGIMSAGSLGGGGEVTGQILVFDQVTLQPVREKLSKIFNKTIIAEMGLPEISFRKLDITSSMDDSEALAKLVAAGVISAEEARSELGYEGNVPTGGEGDAPSGDDDDLEKSLNRLEKRLA